MKFTEDGPELVKSQVNPIQLSSQINGAIVQTMGMLGPIANEPMGKALIDYINSVGGLGTRTDDAMRARAVIERTVLKPMNERAARVRNIERCTRDPDYVSGMDKAIAKATLDIGTLTNFTSITGGQALGYVSLDTRMARGTVRPSSFTLYQSLEKSLAWQVVDYWAVASSTGGKLPGSAFSNFSSVSSGALATSAGQYNLSNITLKLMLDGRAITTALAAQNSFVPVQEQEDINAALTVLSTANWASYWGDSTTYSNQFDGIFVKVPAANIFDFSKFSTATSSKGWSAELTLFNLIYEAAAQVTRFGNFGRITHAFQSPQAMGALQSITNTQLNNILSQITELQDRNPIVVNGNLIGMQTRVGNIEFPLDLFIDARNQPIQAIDSTQASIASPTPPTSAAITVSTGAVLNSGFASAYTGAGNSYVYGVAALDASMNESNVTFGNVAAVNVPLNGAVNVAITPADANQVAFRVYRGGLGYSGTDVTKISFVGTIAANGATAVTFVDLNGGGNTFIPGSTSVFLLDMDPMDLAIDFRVLLPLVKIELFANNLFMPWAITEIGAVRVRIPKFHGVIKNVIATNPIFNPLSANI